jgi:hypothetical protein
VERQPAAGRRRHALGHHCVFVGPKITVAEMVKDSAGWCTERDGEDLNLMIDCHGLPAYLQICKEGLTTGTLSKLAPLKPPIAWSGWECQRAPPSRTAPCYWILPPS